MPDGDLAFRGFGRCPTGHDGTWKIVTLKPGPLPAGDGRTEAPHIDVSVFARGMLDRSVTRIYFPDEEDANAADPVLQTVARRTAARTLIARPDGGDSLPLRHPHARRRRDRLLRPLGSSARDRVSAESWAP